MTKIRSAVLDAVKASSSPVNAADVILSIADSADPASVYRALHYLTEEGFLEEFAFSCEERGLERYYIDRQRPHCHFFHCEGCHRFFPVHGCGAQDIARHLEEEEGYRVESHILYFTGLCPACQNR